MEIAKMILLAIIMEMPIAELNEFHKLVDHVIKTKADILLYEQADFAHIMEEIDDLDDSKVYFREMTHPSELEREAL